MRRPRAIVTGVAAITLACTFLVAATALAFTDVPDSHPHAGAINELAGLGVVSGKGDDTFRPDDLVHRAQFAKMMCGLLGLTVSESESYAPFLDLGPDDLGDLYPHEFVGAAYRLGVIKGKTAIAFAPYADITLAQVVTMVVRAADARYPALLATPPADWQGRWDDTDPTHGANIRRTDYAGLLANLPVGSPGSEPSRPATRGEVSQILFDLLQKIKGGSAPDVQKELEFTHLTIDSSGPNHIWLKTVGDLNGDGRPDLVAGGHDSGGLVWYQNPSWTKKVIAQTGRFSTDGEVGDVDKDGDNDVVVLTSSGLLWYENPSWQSHPIGDEPLHDLELADLDADGDLDLAARDQGEFGHSGKVLHLYRQDTPTSWTHRTVNIADGEGLLLADLDRDGDRDVVVNGSWYENTKDILNGPWTKHTYTSSWTHPNVYVAAGDINGDGRVDLVLAPSELAGHSYRLSWFAGPADPRSGGWQEHVVDDPVETVMHFVGLADFDNDGDLDIAAAEMQQGDDPDEVSVYANVDGDGLTWNPIVLAGTGSHSMRIVDADDDGDMDLYGANWKDNQVEFWLNETP